MMRENEGKSAWHLSSDAARAIDSGSGGGKVEDA
jgi:hypothetical protein